MSECDGCADRAIHQHTQDHQHSHHTLYVNNARTDCSTADTRFSAAVARPSAASTRVFSDCCAAATRSSAAAARFSEPPKRAFTDVSVAAARFSAASTCVFADCCAAATRSVARPLVAATWR